MALQKMLELKVTEDYLQSLVDYFDADYRVREWDEIYLGDLVYNCLRRPFISKIVARLVGSLVDMQGIFRMSIGKKLHEIPMWENPEASFQWEGIRTRVDEFTNGILMDKKYTWTPPKYGVRAQHARQIEYERAIIEENGESVLAAFVVYFNMSKVEFPITRPVEFKRAADVVRQEMLGKKKILRACLDTYEPPDRNVSWLCSYCNVMIPCFRWEQFWKRVGPLMASLDAQAAERQEPSSEKESADIPEDARSSKLFDSESMTSGEIEEKRQEIEAILESYKIIPMGGVSFNGQNFYVDIHEQELVPAAMMTKLEAAGCEVFRPR